MTRYLRHSFFYLTTVVFSLVIFGIHPTHADSAEEIDIRVDVALERFRTDVSGGGTFLKKATGVLTFPRVIKTGFGIGGKYGEGALRTGGRIVDYYNTAAASIGFQLGRQIKTVVLVLYETGRTG